MLEIALKFVSLNYSVTRDTCIYYTSWLLVVYNMSLLVGIHNMIIHPLTAVCDSVQSI